MNAIIKSLFGEYEQKQVCCYTLSNAKGNCVSVINYGGIITSWLVKGKNIVAGFDNLKDYVENDSYFGCITGRYANRIANGKFSINGNMYNLSCNDGNNHLHGGNRGFDKRMWEAEIKEKDNMVCLHYLSKDGEEGYPGNLKVKVEYSYTDDDELIIGYFAETDKPTPVNLTNHSYFNLTGDISRDILGHSLVINADQYIPVNMNQIPTGELKVVDETAFDFRKPVVIFENNENLKGGYDHTFVLNKTSNDFSFAALLAAPQNDLQLSVFTTESGLQLYTGNLLNGSSVNRDGKPIEKCAALCLETQHFPDSPNQPGFPSSILLPGNKYFSKTAYIINSNSR